MSQRIKPLAHVADIRRAISHALGIPPNLNSVRATVLKTQSAAADF
jgi:hypothetical protein